MVSTATAATLLDAEAFNQLVLENKLATWETGGYIYAGLQGPKGWELYRAYGPKIRFLYQARRINTQDNAGGGALTTRISLGEGQTATIVGGYVIGTASAGATLTIDVTDEDNAQGPILASIAAGASRITSFPTVGTAQSGHGNLAASNSVTLGPGQYLRFISSAALVTETQTIYIALMLSSATTPTWDTTGSAGTPNLAASTISTANTLQAVVAP